jgi:hypothetical protein
MNLYKLGSNGILLPRKDAGIEPIISHKKVFLGKSITRLKFIYAMDATKILRINAELLQRSLEISNNASNAR